MELAHDVYNGGLLLQCLLVCPLVIGACYLVSDIIDRYMPPEVDIAL
jgi:hypothetical protein